MCTECTRWALCVNGFWRWLAVVRVQRERRLGRRPLARRGVDEDAAAEAEEGGQRAQQHGPRGQRLSPAAVSRRQVRADVLRLEEPDAGRVVHKERVRRPLSAHLLCHGRGLLSVAREGADWLDVDTQVQISDALAHAPAEGRALVLVQHEVVRRRRRGRAFGRHIGAVRQPRDGCQAARERVQRAQRLDERSSG